MKYCKACLYPDTKPDLHFSEEGICSACLAFDARKNKNWTEWEAKFSQIIKNNKVHPVYDCIIPVSGGKDSTYQVLKVLEYGFNPLCVNARTDFLSPLGRENLDNIAKLGVDLIEVNTNRKVRNKLARYALTTVGDISWGEHVAIFTIPFNLACNFGIPLIIYGENPQNEYGAGPPGTESVYELGYDWLQEFGGLNGLRVSDMIDAGIATKAEMYQYEMPSNFTLELVKPKAIFLGQFFPWDGQKNAMDAFDVGFRYAPKIVEGTSVTYENLDNYYTGIHDYFKYIKFGFGRTTDIVNNKLRRGLISRQKAIDTVYHHDGMSPKSYLDLPLRDILTELDLGLGEFHWTVKKFTNMDLFELVGEWPRAKFKDKLKSA